MEVVNRERVVFMWGYLPGALPQRAPLASPVLVRIPDSIDHSWTDVCGGGCGFAMAISDMWAVGAILAELFPSSPIFPGERLEDMKDQLRKRMFTKRVVRRIFMAHVGYRLLTFGNSDVSKKMVILKKYMLYVTIGNNHLYILKHLLAKFYVEYLYYSKLLSSLCSILFSILQTFIYFCFSLFSASSSSLRISV